MSAETALQFFDFHGATIRVVMVDGDPWWVAADIARVLEFRDAERATRPLDDDEKGTALSGTPGGPQRMTVVSESGLYALVMRSRMPEAKRFRKWVTSEVIPSIRKTGSYSVAPAPVVPEPVALPTHVEALRGWADALEAKGLAQAQAAALKEPAAAWESLASAEGDYSLRDAAHILNRDHGIDTGQNRLMKSLHALAWVDKKGTPYASHGKWLCLRPRTYRHPKTEEVTVARPQVRVTGDGLSRLRVVLGGDS